jgi:hypothetical protein
MNEFKNDFGFLLRFLLTGRTNDEYQRMKEVCKQMIKPDK